MQTELDPKPKLGRLLQMIAPIVLVAALTGVAFGAANIPFSGTVTDASGTGLANVTVFLSPILKGVGRGAEPNASAAHGLNVVQVTTSEDGSFSGLVESIGEYSVCTAGAAIPLLNICSFVSGAKIRIGAQGAEEPMRLLLQEGQIVTLSISDAAAMIQPENTSAELAVDQMGFTSAYSRDVTSALARFRFLVPKGSSGKAIVRCNLRLADVSRLEVARGVPSIIWSTTNPDLVLSSR